MRRLLTISLFAVLLLPVCAAAEEDPFVQLNLLPEHDTYATHNDKSIHGFDPVLKVGIEPQECFSSGWDPCPDKDLVCCEDTPEYNFCAPEGQCASTPPTWDTFRKWHGYVRFDLSGAPADAKVVSATLRFQQMDKVQAMGGPPKVEVYRLKKIGMGDQETCQWSEATLNDTNGTTWSSLPQNVSVTPEGVWAFDVTKAAKDWLEGDADVQGTPIQPNCGFHLYDPDFGKADKPLQRWVLFSSKEGGFAPQLAITFAKDLDGDGYFGDCDEQDAAVHPGAVEVCNQVDDDCDGLKDEEDCDGYDNDCDGEVDEGDDLCPDGTTCIFHKCVKSCYDDCKGPTDLKCEKNEAGVWEKYGCKNVDEDPCLDWYMAQSCDPDEFCQYGYCSFNCIDLCEPAELGTTSCQKNSVGKWAVATCDDWDADGCLEWGNEQWCGPGASCVNSQCNGGCQDLCPALGATQCAGDLEVEGCFDTNGDGCLEWSVAGQCNADLGICKDGDCPLYEPTCTNECEPGTTQCKLDDQGEAYEFWCVTDQDADPCREWGSPTKCAGGCSDDGATCAPAPVETPPEPTPETAPEAVAEAAPDVVALPDLAEVVEDVPASDTAPTPDAAAEVAPVPDVPAPLADAVAADTAEGGEEGGGGSDDGCALGSDPQRPASSSVLVLLAALAVLALSLKARARSAR
jgi:hypothetical protein